MLRKEIILLVKNNRRNFSHILKKIDQELWNFVNCQVSGRTFSEKLYKWCYPENRTHCLVCEQPANFLDFFRGYGKYCSVKCTGIGSVNNKKITCLAKYGVNHYSSTNEYKKKFKNTCFERYGVENPGQIVELKQQRIREKQRTFFNNLLGEVYTFSSPLFDFEEYAEVREVKQWICKLCNNVFDSHCFNKLPKCPLCFPTAQYGGQSLIEKEIIDYIKNDLLYNKDIIENTREIIPPKELDIYLPDVNLAIEVCGLYWHSSKFCKPSAHQEKANMCENNNVKLLTIFDDEWREKTDIVKRRIAANLGCDKSTFGARECLVREISYKESVIFLSKYHLHKNVPSSVRIGLFYDDELVSVATFGKYRFSKKNNNWELLRLASNSSIPGAPSKMITFFKRKYKPTKIISYADRCWSTGKLYKILGFNLIGKTKPNYWYWNKDGKSPRLNRLSFTKKSLINEGFPSNKTEFQIMEERGFYRIYDCGSLKYEWRDV